MYLNFIAVVAVPVDYVIKKTACHSAFSSSNEVVYHNTFISSKEMILFRRTMSSRGGGGEQTVYSFYPSRLRLSKRCLSHVGENGDEGNGQRNKLNIRVVQVVLVVLQKDEVVFVALCLLTVATRDRVITVKLPRDIPTPCWTLSNSVLAATFISS